MPPLKRKTTTSSFTQMKKKILNAGKFGVKILTDPSYTWKLAILLMLAEIVVNVLIVNYVKYTEIDWIAYMQEVEGFLNGTRDYMELKGGTGPLVYPAGFVYVYSLLYYVTDHGTNIRLAQYIFCAFYVINFMLVAQIYQKTKQCPPYVLIFMSCTSYRIHSIFVLRLFNDPLAMVMFYAAVNFFMHRKWTIGCVFFSLAVSIKMNILLFAPALLIILLSENGILKTVGNLAVCFFIQVFLAIPFLIGNPSGYIIRSFDFGRQFFYVWTVNWRVIPEEIFLNRKFQLSLLLCHLIMLFVFSLYKWSKGFLDLFSLIDPRKNWKSSMFKLSPNSIVSMLFMSNFIGMCFSRSLHYQFYVWYYHTLPFLLYSMKINSPIRLMIFGLIELSWNTFPATFLSSLSLHIMHFLILIGLLFIPVKAPSNDCSSDRSIKKEK